MAKSLDWGGLRGRRKEDNGGHQRTTSSPVAMEENGGAEQRAKERGRSLAGRRSLLSTRERADGRLATVGFWVGLQQCSTGILSTVGCYCFLLGPCSP